MSSGTTKAVDLSHYAPRFVISINNNNVDISRWIISVQVNEKLNSPAEAKISVSDKFDIDSETFKWLDNDLFQVGNLVDIQMGYAEKLKKMMSGKITRLEPSFFSDGAPTLVLNVQDPLHILTKKMDPEDRKKFSKDASKKITDSKIAEMIGDFINEKLNAGLRMNIEKTDVEYNKIQLPGEINFYDFLKQRADRIYYEFYIRDKVFYFISPETDKDAILTLQWGRDLLKFNPSISSTELVTEVVVKSRDSSTGKNIEGKASKGDEKSSEKRKQPASELMAKFYGEVKEVKMEITNIPVSSKAEADKIAKAQLNKASDTLIKGDVETIGMTEIRPGVNIMLEKVGKIFSGKYYVEETTHTIDGNGYRTSFKVRRNAL